MIATTIATSMPLTAFAQAAADAAANTNAAANANTNAAPAAASTASTGAASGNVPSDTVACQSGWFGTSWGFGCALASFSIMLIAALIGGITWLMYYSDYLFSYAITSTIIDFNSWYSSLQGKIASIWGIFRDLANILIIGLFVFIAISIILGLQEYGQRRLIARVIIVAILINFSFLFTIIVINTSNLFATQIYGAIQQMAPQSADPTAAPPGIGQQLATYMGLGSIQDTRNVLMSQYNSPAGFEAVFLHAFFLTVFALGAIVVFLYASFLLFARFIVLILLLILSAAAFASYLSPGWAESGWSRWWNSLLRNAFFAPIFMLFLLATVNLASGLASKGASGGGGTLGAFAAGAPSNGPWDSAFVYIAILGLFFGGVVISSQIATGVSRRFANVGAGAVGGAGAALGAFAGRWGIGRSFAVRAHKLDEDKKSNRAEHEAAYKRGDTTAMAQLDAKYQRLQRQQTFATNQAKRTFDLRNTAVGSLLKATGAPKGLTEGTKKNYADLAHAEAEKAAKEGAKAAISNKDATTIAKERAKQTYGDAEAAHDSAQQQVRDARQDMRQVREEGERVAEQHEREAREAREHQQELERQHAATTDEAERTRLQTQITTVGERIAAARRSAESARASANNEAARMLPELKTLESKAKITKEKLGDFKAAVKNEAEAVKEQNKALVGAMAKGSVGGRLAQAIYRSTGISDPHMLHEAEVAALARAKIKDKAEEKKKIDEYNKPAHAPAPSGGAAAGGDHH